MSVICIYGGIYYYFHTGRALQKIIDSCPKKCNYIISRLFFKYYCNYLQSPIYRKQLKVAGFGWLIMGVIMLYLALSKLLTK